MRGTPVEPFVEQLKRLCREHPTRAKWVFVPSHSIGRTVGDRIVLEGTDWANLRFVTPLDVALRMGAPFLVERGIDPSMEELGPALMMRLLLDLPLKGGYFRPLADHPTLAQALWATVRELRMAGVRPHALAPHAFASPAKHAEIVALLSAYERFLDEHSRADMAAVYQEAVRHADWCPIQPQDCWTELPDANWNPLQRALLDTLPGERLTPRTLALPGVSMPRRIVSLPAERLKADATTNPLAFLMTPAFVARSGAPKPEIHLFQAGGREAEIEEVFRRILAAGVTLDHVEIACASDAHLTLIWEKALRHDWPVTLGAGIPAALTRPGRALLGLCDWIETDFSAGHLRRLLQSGDISVEESVEEYEGFTAGQAARVLARAEAGWGRATYGLALARLCKGYEARAADPEASDEDRADAREKAERAARVRAWIGELVASVPMAGDEGTVPLQTVVTGVLDFLERRTARSNALDHRAAATLQEHVGELRALGEFSCALSQALRFVRERVQSLTVAPERPRPGHLYASHLSQAGYAGRPVLFVVGLEEGRVFSSSTEDAILLDAERAAISTDLRLSTDRIDEAVYGVLSHSRPRVSNDNPFSEAQFRTFKYRPEFPDRFGSIEHGRRVSRDLFAWYNDAHHHSGLTYLTPADVHYGRAATILEGRHQTRLAAYLAHPERFVQGPPRLERLPHAVWINPPAKSTGQDAPGTTTVTPDDPQHGGISGPQLIISAPAISTINSMELLQ